jgi:hypothetical protein
MPQGRQQSRSIQTLSLGLPATHTAIYARYSWHAYNTDHVRGRLVTIDRSGVKRHVGTAINNYEYSLSGSMLTGVDSERPAVSAIRWRNLTTGEHGTAPAVASERYLGASPTGYVFVHDGDQVAERAEPSGEVTELGTPFSSSSDQITGALSGPHGIVMLADMNLAYLSFTHPGTVTALDTSMLKPEPGGFEIDCSSVNAAVVTCTEVFFRQNDEGDEDVGPTPRVFVDPVDGSPATLVLHHRQIEKLGALELFATGHKITYLSGKTWHPEVLTDTRARSLPGVDLAIHPALGKLVAVPGTQRNDGRPRHRLNLVSLKYGHVRTLVRTDRHR